ncbi:PREDICTED: histone-lysine N-methyltransferase, H3 lysine-9 specific SUVH5-like [Ipomoea nil]|uniref:histone-lysine N-methyltransferase, H3 lysine-9 specific SUVH5-like n=1 Tax=Ipomoea nil TaxID=35883 RepID=UPI000901E642|nr:PREDICTED: histone-lysine N-methyltransferase, H3 lysine-9 specific SUVH5-like [Ipomoea nil]
MLIWSNERSPTSGMHRKRLFGYNNDQFHGSPSNFKKQKIDVTTKYPEYFDARHASAEIVVIALPARHLTPSSGNQHISCKELDASKPRTGSKEVDSPATLMGTNLYNVASSEDCSEGCLSGDQKPSQALPLAMEFPPFLSQQSLPQQSASSMQHLLAGYGEACELVQVRRNYDCDIVEVEDDEICNLPPHESHSFQSNHESLLSNDRINEQQGKQIVDGERQRLCSRYKKTKKLIDKNKQHVDSGDSEQNLVISPTFCNDSASEYYNNIAPTNECSLVDSRKQVLNVLEHFKQVYNKLLEETKGGSVRNAKGGVPMKAASFLRKQQKWLQDKPTFGVIPGVKIGDTYQFRVELAIVGLHLQYIAGIDYTDLNGKFHATSVVDSGHYKNEVKSLDTLIYVGSGANPKFSSSDDQKLEKGNLALKNSMDAKLPIRVICLQKTLGMSSQGYTYAGLYIVSNYKQERDQRGKLVFKFELRRLSGQPNLTLPIAWDWEPIQLTEREGGVNNRVVVDDVSQGKEKFPIPAVNDIDDEKPPPFTYITKMIYPRWFHCTLPKGCNCKNGCSDSKPCPCTHRNGCEIPFNNKGSILKAKPVIYECGPSCKCPPSCNNRVSQNGPIYQLEVFKTKSRGWGVRSRDYISSGSFICEYLGELLDEKEAEKRIECDEYLFDIGNYDEGEGSDMTDIVDICRKDSDGFTVDAAQLGNVGRFFNHSCSPNLYAQNVLFDHDDKRAPHLMLFAQEDIPPLQELTYDYNYKMDQVRDANGNLKKKNCYCGFPECTGRMY